MAKRGCRRVILTLLFPLIMAEFRGPIKFETPARHYGW